MIMIALFCVLGISLGQLLFKMSATYFERAGSYTDSAGILTLFLALILYGITTVAWVFVLQKLSLGRAYPLMALAFVLVPFGSYVIFNERFEPFYIIGILLIMVGIMMTVRNN